MTEESSVAKVLVHDLGSLLPHPGHRLEPLESHARHGVRQERREHHEHRHQGEQRLSADGHGAVDDLDADQLVDAATHRRHRVEHPVRQVPGTLERARARSTVMAHRLPGDDPYSRPMVRRPAALAQGAATRERLGRR